jgi:uncharacterized membrane protein YdbT with pleckstrin-like domain
MVNYTHWSSRIIWYLSVSQILTFTIFSIIVMFPLLYFLSVIEFEGFSTSEFPLYISMWFVVFFSIVSAVLVTSVVTWKTTSYQILIDNINLRSRVPIIANYDFSIPFELIKHVELKTDLIAKLCRLEIFKIELHTPPQKPLFTPISAVRLVMFIHPWLWLKWGWRPSRNMIISG